jgi:hypothetical protein
MTREELSKLDKCDTLACVDEKGNSLYKYCYECPLRSVNDVKPMPKAKRTRIAQAFRTN